MRPISEVTFPDTVVMFVAGNPGRPIPEQSQQAFAALEGALDSLRGRRFFGVVVGGGYRACASLVETDDVADLPHPTWTIPGGRYARRRIPDWEQHSEQIGPAFEALYALPNVDPRRPAIEYYRSRRELFVMVPIE